jgi:hypothetical protein
LDLRLLELALATLAIGTGSLVFAGLIGGVAEDRSISVGYVEQLITVNHAVRRGLPRRLSSSGDDHEPGDEFSLLTPVAGSPLATVGTGVALVAWSVTGWALTPFQSSTA